MYRIGKEEIDAVAKVIESRKLFRMNQERGETDSFEKELAEKMGTEHALCVSGGTTALICALAGLGIGPGDEVIVPGYTFMATALAVLAVGAIPVIAEVDDSLTLDMEDAERKISRHTKAIIPVHMVGFPCNMEKAALLAEKYHLKILEDACQASGGSYRGKRLGALGDIGAFSYNYFKIMTAGEGGAIVTNDLSVFEKALIHHDGGTAFRPYAKTLSVPIFIGSQYRVSEITGAILRIQLQRLDGMLEDLRKTKRKMIAGLSDMPEISFTRSNDPAGDCGTTLGFSFPDEAKARKFAGSEGVSGWLPIDSGKHVYTEWEPIMEKRGSYHPGLNPYLMLRNRELNMNYSRDMCPKTLDLLRRNVFISLSPDWGAEEIERRIESCRKAVYEIYR